MMNLTEAELQWLSRWENMSQEERQIMLEDTMGLHERCAKKTTEYELMDMELTGDLLEGYGHHEARLKQKVKKFLNSLKPFWK